MRASPFKSLQRVDLILKGDTSTRLRARWRAARLGRRRVRLAEDPRRDGEGHAGRADLRGGAATARGRDQGRLLPAVRLSGRDARRTSSAPCRWSATAGRTTSGCRSRTRCPGRGSTATCATQLGASRTGGTPTTSPCCIRGRSPPRSIASCTSSCTRSSASRKGMAGVLHSAEASGTRRRGVRGRTCAAGSRVAYNAATAPAGPSAARAPGARQRQGLGAAA